MIHKNFNSLGLLIVLAILTLSCSPKFSFTWTQPNYEPVEYKKVVVYAISGERANKLRFESTMVAVLKEKGIDAVSATVDYKGGRKLEEMDSEKLEKQLLEDGVDGILTVAVVDKNVETVYNEGMTYTVPTYGRTFRGYHSRTYATVQEPGYYSKETTYLLETNFYQLGKGSEDTNDALVWSAQSEESQPNSPKKFSQKYSEQIYEQLVADRILK